MVESAVQSHAEIVVGSTEKKLIRVLHVDDELGLLKVAKQCLELQGPFQVDTAGSVEEALAKLENEQYDAVVSDFQMPGKDGLEFLEMLRKNGNTIPFIIFTGKGREEVALRAWSLGGDHYINKTGDPETVYCELAHCLRTSVEKHAAKARAEETIEKFEGLFRHNPEAAVYLGANFKIVDVNPRFCQLFGYSAEEVKGRSINEVIVPEGMRSEAEGLDKDAKNGYASHDTVRKRKDMSLVSVSISAAPVTFENKLLGYVGIYKDITERVRMDAALKESEMKLRSIIENSSDQIFMFDRNFRFLSINKAATDLFGKSPQEMVGRSISEVFPETIAAQFSRNIKNVFDTGKSMFIDEEIVGEDRELYSSTSLNPVKDDNGRVIAVTGIVRDITERKKTEKMLQESEEKFRAIFEGANDGILLADVETKRFSFANPRICEITGYSLEELLKLGVGDIHPKNDLPYVIDSFTKLMQGKLTITKDIPVLRKEGRVVYCDVSARSVKIGSQEYLLGLFRDVTERKKTEQTLRASLERYQSFIEVTGELGWTTNSEGEVVEDIPSFRKFTGQTYEEMKGWGWSKAIHPDDLERATQIWKEATGTKSKYETEYRLRRYDGIYRYFMARGVPIFEEDGSIREWVGTCIDITERKVIEDELRSSQERLKILFESAPDAYYLNDLKGNLIDGNKAAEELTGYKKNELIGKSFLKLKLLPRSQALKAVKLLAMNALGKPTGPDEFVLNRRDGTQVPAEIRTHPVKIKDKTLVLGIARDISIRRKNEQTILENQQKFEGLFRHNPEAAVYLDLDSKVLDVNPRFCELFGYSAKEVEGKQINEIVVPKDMIEEAETLDKDAKKGYASHDTVRKRKDGSLVRVSISASPVTVEGRLLGYVGVYKNITELKNAEERLKKMNKVLEVTNEKLHVVGGLTRHDVRNKLSTVTGNAYLLRRKLAEDPKALEQLNDMEAAVRLVERIFEFARIYEKLGTEQLVNIDVGKAVDGAVSLFSGLKGVKVVNECGGLTVLADSLLSQLFYNLIDNSLRYGEKIQQIRVYYKTLSSDQLELVYEDDGVGIPDNIRSNLFKEGFTSGKGTGYGLFMIKRICEVYGWAIAETGVLGKGAQFTVNIPRAKPDERQNYKLG